MKVVCVDSCVAIKWVVDAKEETNEIERAERSVQARALLAHWQEQGITPIVPPVVFDGEVRKILHFKYSHNYIDQFQWFEALTTIRSIVEVRDHPDLDYYAFGFERYLEHRHTYDTAYLALAALYGCEFWTNDKDMSNKQKENIADTFPFVKLLSSFHVPEGKPLSVSLPCSDEACIKQMHADRDIALKLNPLHPGKIKERVIHFIPGIWGDGSNGSPVLYDPEYTTVEIDPENHTIG